MTLYWGISLYDPNKNRSLMQFSVKKNVRVPEIFIRVCWKKDESSRGHQEVTAAIGLHSFVFRESKFFPRAYVIY